MPSRRLRQTSAACQRGQHAFAIAGAEQHPFDMLTALFEDSAVFSSPAHFSCYSSLAYSFRPPSDPQRMLARSIAFAIGTATLAVSQGLPLVPSVLNISLPDSPLVIGESCLSHDHARAVADRDTPESQVRILASMSSSIEAA